MKMLGQYSTFLCSALRGTVLISVRCNIRDQMSEVYNIEELNAICRNSNVYPVKRIVVPKDKVSWSIPWPEYAPPNCSAPHLSNASWADPDIADVKFKPKWNEDDEGIDRKSYDQNETIKYDIIDGCPLNPRGRTGLSGRGRLGRWGPNHAGDAIVSRWKYLNDEMQLDSESGLPILQFVAILRKDCNKWALPGGFVDPKEASSSAVLRELCEEAINMKNVSDEVKKPLEEFFKNGRQVYRGYVDDPRNTDNAWIETTAVNFHDDSGQIIKDKTLDARDDAADVKWIDIVKDMDIYPPHYTIIEHLKNLHFAKT